MYGDDHISCNIHLKFKYMKYSTLLSLAVLLSPFVPSAENHSEQLNLNFNSS